MGSHSIFCKQFGINCCFICFSVTKFRKLRLWGFQSTALAITSQNSAVFVPGLNPDFIGMHRYVYAGPLCVKLRLLYVHCRTCASSNRGVLPCATQINSNASFHSLPKLGDAEKLIWQWLTCHGKYLHCTFIKFARTLGRFYGNFCQHIISL